jgi:hypothetical protein
MIPEHTARNTWPKPKVPGSTFKMDAFCSGTWRSPSKVGTTRKDDTAESCPPRLIIVSHILAVKFNNIYIRVHNIICVKDIHFILIHIDE